METLTIKTPTRAIAMDLDGNNLSITMGDHGSAQAPIGEPERLEWSKTLCNGDIVTYKEAERAVAELGEGWRLPTRQELESLLDLSRHDPAIDTNQFPDTESAHYWTSTPCAWNDAAVWVVHFYYGNVNGNRRNGLGCVRAVRASQ